MNRLTKRSLLSLLPALVIAVTAWPAEPVAQLSGEKPKFEYFGSSNCQRCHFQPIQQDFDEGRTHFLGMNESQIWESHDRHSKAFKLLECDRGQAIGRRLGWNVAQDQRCLSCHANWQSDRNKPDDSVVAEGVACEACHGPSSKYINEHTNPKWRATAFHERAADFGMFTLRDPRVRAEVCLSCHIGNAAQGKIITHEMYAAGHPPLPSFELRDFSEGMKHWSDIADQLAKLEADRPPHAAETRRDLQFIRSQLDENDETNSALKTVLYGAVKTLRGSVELLANEAGGVVNQAADVSHQTLAAWPEFAMFDCAMCHHDLRYPAWRQNRLTAAPGRPQIPRWPQALVTVAIDQIAGADSALAEKMKQEFTLLNEGLDAPFRRQPFGDATAIAEPAMKLVAFLDRLLDQMQRLKFNRPAASRALEQLCDAALNGTLDYDSARQLAWAFQSIYKSVEPPPNNTPSGKHDSAREKIDQEVALLNTELRLSLNPIQSNAKDVCSQAISNGDLQAAMQMAAAYSPERLQQHFRILRSELNRIPE